MEPNDKNSSKPFLKPGSFLFMVLAVFSLLYLVGQKRQHYKEYWSEHSSYTPISQSEVAIENKFVVIIPAYNNESFVEKNLKSIFDQTYANFRVIYIDDCSDDYSYERAVEFAEIHGYEDRITFIKNVKNQKALYNLYYAIHSLEDDEIVLLLNGGDWFATPDVFSLLNRYYNDQNIWMTYGQYVTYPEYKRGNCRETIFSKASKSKDVGDSIFSHLRTFYAGLFKRIQLKDLIFDGYFYSAAWSEAMMFPMLEMAKDHAVFVPEVNYVYNKKAANHVNKIEEEEHDFCFKHIREREAYPPLTTHPKIFIPQHQNEECDLFIFSQDRPLQLFSCLESIYKYTKSVKKIRVFYNASNEKFEKGYREIERNFSKVTLHSEDLKSREEFKKRLVKLIDESPSNYISLIEDKVILKDYVDLKEPIFLMEKSGATGFFLHLGLHIHSIPNNLIPVSKNCFLWSFFQAENDWKSTHNLQMTIYRKKDITRYLNFLKFDSINSFSKKWNKGVDLGGMGLCYNVSKALEAPCQVITKMNDEKVVLYTPEELNERFLEGFKLDISALYQLENRETKIEHYPLFVAR